MTSIRRFVYVALLAAAAFNFAPKTASAEEPAKGKFTLTHDVMWGNAKIPAGEYQFSYNIAGVSPVLVLSKISGSPAGYMVLVRATKEIASSASSHLVLETSPDGSYVSTMQLPEFGMALEFSAPRKTEKQFAKAAIATSAGQ
ncbi:MAG TPA: hypothetical protein VM715_02100 [Candidatus Acidoferrum sp.]|jgi:hypothetical protein|nr:hypothetical protein [Candidatus Acidoferrum sp.]